MNLTWNLISESKPPLYKVVLFVDVKGNVRTGYAADPTIEPFPLYLYTVLGHDKSKWEDVVRWAELPEKPDDVQRVFISQPMSGRTIVEIENEREELMDKLHKEFPDTHWIEIASFDATKLNNGKPIEELGKCISLMQEADIVLFSPKWATSVGCTIEHSIATKYGIWRYYLQEDGTFVITD